MSDILRLIAGGLLALICCYVGVLIKKRYKAREDFYGRALSFANALSSEMALQKTPVPEIANKFMQGQNGEFEKTLDKCMQLALNGEDYASMLDKVSINILKQDEKKELMTFFSALGKTSLSDQLTLISAYAKTFGERKDKCAKDSKQLGNMYFKLSVLLGLALILILS